MPCGKNNLDSFLQKQLDSRAYQKRRVQEYYSAVPQRVWDEMHPALTEDRDIVKAVMILKSRQDMSVNEAKAVVDLRCETLKSAK